MATMTRTRIETGIAAAKTRNGDGPRYGRSRSRSALDALRAGTGDQSDRQQDQAEDRAARWRGPATGEDRDERQPETEQGPSQPRTNRPAPSGLRS